MSSFLHNQPGFVLSNWLTDHSDHPKIITPRFVELNLECVGDKYGHQSRLNSWGMNHYIGIRTSAQSRSSPVEEPKRAQESKYFCQGCTHFQFFPMLHRK